MTAAEFDQRGADAAAHELFPAADAVCGRVSLTCRAAADGRRAVRALSEWAHRFDLGETDFQVLWSLQSASTVGHDQTTLASKLACSPAQVSATVERMRSRGWIVQQSKPGDRRRHVWKLSVAGRDLLDQMLRSAGLLREFSESGSQSAGMGRPAQEAAA